MDCEHDEETKTTNCRPSTDSERTNMSKTTKKKIVMQEVMDDFPEPTKDQSIVKVNMLGLTWRKRQGSRVSAEH